MEGLTAKISKAGYVSTIPVIKQTKFNFEKEYSTEEWVGKITSLFTPFMMPTISETKFMDIEKQVKKVVVEIKGR